MNGIQAKILKRVLGRDTSLFRDAVEECEAEIENVAQGARLLVLGAAGSVGRAFVQQVAGLPLAALDLVDLSENNLVELVRYLRSSRINPAATLRTFALDAGSIEFSAFMRAQHPYDFIMNFTALKHVRAERDPFTLMRMVATNVLNVADLLQSDAGRGAGRFFSVSSDKAVNPASVMGATKSFMERVMRLYATGTLCTTARFANVAFSDGSLLDSFTHRLAHRQPLSAPNDVKRFFMSHEEAGQLCMLSACLGQNRDVFVPALQASVDMKSFSEIALIFLDAHGYVARECATDDEARDFAASMGADSRAWPCVFTPSDTRGEKPFEELSSDTEYVDYGRFHGVGVIKTSAPSEREASRIVTALHSLQAVRRRESWTAEDIEAAVRLAVPELGNDVRTRNLDEKM